MMKISLYHVSENLPVSSPSFELFGSLTGSIRRLNKKETQQVQRISVSPASSDYDTSQYQPL